jgi:hypothetical protein
MPTSSHASSCCGTGVKARQQHLIAVEVAIPSSVTASDAPGHPSLRWSAPIAARPVAVISSCRAKRRKLVTTFQARSFPRECR